MGGIVIVFADDARIDARKMTKGRNNVSSIIFPFAIYPVNT